MVTLNMLTEVLRRHGIGDPVSKISVDLKTPESTIRDWLKFLQVVKRSLKAQKRSRHFS